MWDNGVWVNEQGIPDYTVSPYAPGGPFAPGGDYATPDPVHPGYWYVVDPNAIAGVQRLDSAGNVVGRYQNTSPRTQGGSDFDFSHVDPATGAPAIMQYPTEQGGLFGLGDVWGSVAAVAMLAAIGASAGTLTPAVAPAAGAAGAAGAGTLATIGAGATLGSTALSVAAEASQNADVLRAAQALGLAGLGTSLGGNLASGLSEGGSLGLSDAAQTAQFANRASNFPASFEGASGAFGGGGGTGTLQGGSGTDTLRGGGGSSMADTSGGTGTFSGADPLAGIDLSGGSGSSGGGVTDWLQALAPLLTSGVGLAGSGLQLAAMPEVLKRLETLYNQSQGNFQLQTQYAQMYQAMLQHYQQQQQQAFQEQTGQTATDRANAAVANEGRAGIAGRLSDPAQVAAGAQQIYQPMSAGMTDNLLRVVQRDLAMRGQSDGGAASRATADAMAPYYNQLQQQAMQNFLASQQGALGAYNPLRGPYSPDPPRPPEPAQLPKPSQYVPGASGGPQANQAGAYQGLSNQVAQLGKALFGSAASSPGAVALLTKLFGGNKDNASALTPEQARLMGSDTEENQAVTVADLQSQIDSLGGGGGGGGGAAAGAVNYDYGFE